MHGGASTGPATRLGRAVCGHVSRKHGLWSAESRDELREFNERARLTRAMAAYARVWHRPFRRAGALLKLLRTLGRMLPDGFDRRGGLVARWMLGYVRGPVNDVLRWLGERPLAPRERPDSARVIAVLTGSLEACAIGDGVYSDLRRRALRQHAQRRRRAARAAAQGRPVKRALPARSQAAHAPRGSSCGRTAGFQPASSSNVANIVMSRQDVGGPTSLKPSWAVSAQGPHTPREPSSGRTAGFQPASSSTAVNIAMSRQDAGAPSLKPLSAGRAKAPHTPRGSSLGRTAGPVAALAATNQPASSSFAASIAMSRLEAGGPTILKPSFAAGTEAAHAPRGTGRRQSPGWRPCPYGRGPPVPHVAAALPGF
jgi:hypothetical protein